MEGRQKFLKSLPEVQGAQGPRKPEVELGKEETLFTKSSTEYLQSNIYLRLSGMKELEGDLLCEVDVQQWLKAEGIA